VDVGVDPLVEALRDAMSLTDEERRVMGENGRRLVERKYQWERIAAEMVGAYQRIVGMR
jgi:glycosyltransferase involved in cell wall biosynthesis